MAGRKRRDKGDREIDSKTLVESLALASALEPRIAPNLILQDIVECPYTYGNWNDRCRACGTSRPSVPPLSP